MMSMVVRARDACHQWRRSLLGVLAVMRMAVRDALHEWHLSLLAVLAVTAAVLPLFVLLSMRNGILTAISTQLQSDPRLLEVRVIGRGGYTPDDIDRISDWPEVGFVVPRTRFLTSEIVLVAEVEEGARGVPVTLVPTAPGDPLLRDVAQATSPAEIVLADAVAKELEVTTGDTVTAIVRYEDAQRGDRHIERRDLRIAGVLSPRLEQGKKAYAPLDLLRNVERMMEGRPVPDWNWPGRVSEEAMESYAGFRIFAPSMDEVAALQARLRELGLEPRTRLAEIETFQALDANLTRLVLVIAALAGAGVLVSTFVGQYAAVVRKQHNLCLLMLLGYTPRQVSVLPLLSALLSAVLGVLLAGLLYVAVDPAIERAFAGRLISGSEATRMDVGDFAACLFVTLLIALVAASFAALQVTRIAPSVGLRDE